MVRVFLSYSHADEKWKSKLEAHLSMLKRSGEIEVWHDRELIVGDHLDSAISEYLESANLIVFLVSSDFLNSYYCYEREMTRAMERVREGSARVAPIILRACDWKSAPFARYVLSPTDAKPVVEHPDLDAAFLLVVNQLRQAIAKMQTSGKSEDLPTQEPTLPNFSDDLVNSPRTSNLRVRKNFSDADQSRFLDDAFDFIYRFFANSAAELSARHADVEGRVKRIDQEQFTVEIFRNGRRASALSIFISRSLHRAGMICYSSNLDSSRSSMNGGFMVDHDDQIQFLKPWMFMFSRNRDEDAKLSFHGAAELLWEQVIEALQR